MSTSPHNWRPGVLELIFVTMLAIIVMGFLR